MFLLGAYLCSVSDIQRKRGKKQCSSLGLPVCANWFRLCPKSLTQSRLICIQAENIKKEKPPHKKPSYLSQKIRVWPCTKWLCEVSLSLNKNNWILHRKVLLEQIIVLYLFNVIGFGVGECSCVLDCICHTFRLQFCFVF